MPALDAPARLPVVVAAATASPTPVVAHAATPQHYAIVDGSIRRTVAEHEFRAAVPSCTRIEVVHYPSETVVTNVCYR